MRNKKKSIISILSVIIVLILCSVSFYNNKSNTEPTAASVSYDGELAVHFLDVGQGDSTFIELPDDECMLIDAATSDYENTITEKIEQYGYSKIDYLVATHPHADHIGGMTQIVEHFDIGEIYMPKVSADTKTFESLLQAVSDKNMKINTACAGKVIFSDNSLEMKFLSPDADVSYDGLNNYSAVLKITYGENSFLFTGDAETDAEEIVLDTYYNELDCDVLKAGHHGSETSSSVEFLNAVTPDYAVISCGVNNSYGHPHKEALSRLEDVGAEIYRTDTQGTITIACDGKNSFDVLTEGKNELDNRQDRK